MTSFAFLLGMIPLVIATGAGAEMRQALGTAVFFGMIGVTVFGLIFTPICYVLIQGLCCHPLDRRFAFSWTVRGGRNGNGPSGDGPSGGMESGDKESGDRGGARTPATG